MSVKLKPIKTKKIYEEIADQIKQLIVDGYLKPGDKLPTERDLVESLKVSRSSIREALSALEMMGLIEVRTGEGTFIRKMKSESMVSSLVWALYLDKGSVLEILEVRKMIEIQAVEYAAERATSKEINELGQSLEVINNDINYQMISDKVDFRFHYLIALATHNNITIRLMDTIFDNLTHLIRVSRSKLYEGKYSPEFFYKEHMEIYEAIKRRDAKEARSQMLLHLTGVEKQILKNF